MKKEKQAVNLWAKMKQQSQKRWTLAVGLLFLLALLVSFAVPVHYVPLFNNISKRFGLPADVSRKLTLLDLALSSFGIETKNMAEAFKKQEVQDDFDPFYTVYYEAPEGRRLIDAKETYYHEFERTRRRPAEVAGVYKDGKIAETPEIGDTVKGVRSLPKGSTLEGMDYIDYRDKGKTDISGQSGKTKQDGDLNQAKDSKLSGDSSYTDFSYKRSTANTASRDEVLGSSKRQVRGAYDNQGTSGGAQARPKHSDMPDFASTIYNPATGQNETLTLTNSPIQKPIVIGEPFTVVKTENAISQLVGDSSFVDTFSTLRNFGATQGVLGDYVKDNWQEANLFDFLGLSGRDMFLSYFYSYSAIGRKYLESSKHLSEIAFHGDEPQDQVLVARGQKDSKIPTVDLGTPPLVLMLIVKRNMRECEESRRTYEEETRTLRQNYKNRKNDLIAISEGPNNVAHNGVPGSCDRELFDWLGNRTADLRDQWNSIIDDIKDYCEQLDEAGVRYANSCKMEYTRDSSKDVCDAVYALKVNGGSSNFQFIWEAPCAHDVVWTYPSFSPSKTFRGCDSRNDCKNKINELFRKMDESVVLDSQPGFMFVN